MAMNHIRLMLHGALFVLFAASVSSKVTWLAAIALSFLSYGQYRNKAFKREDFGFMRGWATLLVLVGGPMTILWLLTSTPFSSSLFTALGWIVIGLSAVDYQSRKPKNKKNFSHSLVDEKTNGD